MYLSKPYYPSKFSSNATFATMPSLFLPYSSLSSLTSLDKDNFKLAWTPGMTKIPKKQNKHWGVSQRQSSLLSSQVDVDTLGADPGLSEALLSMGTVLLSQPYARLLLTQVLRFQLEPMIWRKQAGKHPVNATSTACVFHHRWEETTTTKYKTLLAPRETIPLN